MKILFVDDEEEIRNVMEEILEIEGHKVVLAENGAEALELLSQETIDLLITDLVMPVLDCMKLLVASKELYPEIPIIMVTAFGSIEKAVEAIKLGAFNFITKPFDMDQILDVVERCAQLRQLSILTYKVIPLIEHGLRIHLPGDLDLARGAVYHISEAASRHEFSTDQAEVDLPLVVGEAIRNAVVHGNKNDPSKFVEIEACVTKDRIVITVTDEGEGFDTSCLDEFLKPERLRETNQRGLMLMQCKADRLSYNDTGNSVTIVMEKETE